MNIEDIQVGDFVYSYNTLTGELELKEVTAVFSLVSDHINYITIVDENGNTQVIETTDGHPFWVVTDEPDLERAAQGMIDENGAILHHNNIAPTEHGFWVEAKDLREGDVFLGANGELSTVVSVERVEFPDGIAVYNLTVDGNHNYFVIAACDEYGQTSVLVHNAQYGNNSTVWGNVRSFVSAFGGSVGAAYRDSLDSIQTAMDIAGNAPIIGSALNAANAAIYAARGDYYSATFSAAGVVPVLGQYGRHAPTAIKAVGSFFDGASYTPRVLQQMKGPAGEFHSFPELVRNFESVGKIRTITGGDGKVRQVLEIPGSYSGRDGVFQFIKDSDGTIRHRMFHPH